MRFNRSWLALAVVLPLLAACKKDTGVITDPVPPLAYVRFVHASPNLGNSAWRFIDGVVFSPFEISLPFRSTGRYQESTTGARRLRVFYQSNQIDSASTILGDTLVNLTAGTYYTIVFTGRIGAGGSPAASFKIYTDTMPTVPAGQFGVRALHAGVGVAGVDVFGDTVGAPLPAAPAFPGLTYLNRSGYLFRNVGTYAVRVTGAGTVAPVLVSATAPVGTPGTTSTNPVAGVAIAGTALTAIAFPPGDVGSPNAAVTTPSVFYVQDKRPPNTVQ
jgi:hypothetical protein